MPSPYKSHGVAVNAYDFDDEIKTLHLVVTRFKGIGDMPPLQNSKIKDIFKRVENFITDLLKDYMRRLMNQQKLMIWQNSYLTTQEKLETSILRS